MCGFFFLCDLLLRTYLLLPQQTRPVSEPSVAALQPRSLHPPRPSVFISGLRKKKKSSACCTPRVCLIALRPSITHAVTSGSGRCTRFGADQNRTRHDSGGALPRSPFALASPSSRKVQMKIIDPKDRNKFHYGPAPALHFP